jgi:hypothetical protein
MARAKLSKPVTVQIKLTLRPGQDDDLIAYFAALPIMLRAASVKQALRSGGMQLLTDKLPSEAEIDLLLDSLLG